MQFGQLKRRDFISALGGALAWPIAAGAQQPSPTPRVGVIMNPAADDPEGKARLTAFVQGLQQSGWTDGRNVRIDTRWAGANAADIRRHVAELVALTPAAILATGSAVTGPLVQATHSVPIVFVLVPDPVGAGFVDSLARPGGNATGFLSFEYGLSGKWLTILKEIAPSVTRAGVIRDPAITAGIGQFAAIQSVAPLVGTEVNAINVRDASEIERAVAAFAGSSNGGLIVTGSGLAFVHCNLLVTLAAQHKLPAVYWDRTPVIGGGLISNRYDHLCEAGPSMKRREFLRILGWGSRRIT